jgi:flagella basal body P-ring formation protein FlgA
VLRLVLPIVLLLAADPARSATLPGGEPLTESIAVELLGEALQAQGAGDRYRVMIERPHLPLANQSPAGTELAVEGLRHDGVSGRFQAVLVGRIDDRIRFRLPVHGRAHALIELPVLARPLAPGDIVREADLKWITVRSDRVQRGSLTAPEQLLGAEARKRLLPGRVLSARDLGPPLVVRSGRLVRLIYVRPGLRLTALGTAQDDGALGQLVRVVNADSRQQLQGTASGPDEVTVGIIGTGLSVGG